MKKAIVERGKIVEKDTKPGRESHSSELRFYSRETGQRVLKLKMGGREKMRHENRRYHGY